VARKFSAQYLLPNQKNATEPMTNNPPEEGRGEGTPEPEKRSRKRARAGILIAIGAVIVLGVIYVRSRSQADQNSVQGRPRGGGGGSRSGGFAFGSTGPLPVVAKAAEKGNLNVYLNGLGTVTPLATVTVRTQINGTLMEIHFQEGQMVNQGDLLSVIDPRPYQVALEQAEGQLLQAQAQLKEAQVDLTRYETLSEQDSIAKQQVDTQRALVTQYQGLVQTDQAAIDSAKLNLTYCHVIAPVSGRVGLRQVDQGNYVTPGDANGLVVLTEVKPITVIFTLPEDNVPQVVTRLHSGATIPVDAFDRTQDRKLASGALSTIDNQIDTTTGTFKLRALFANEDERLFPNQFVNVRMLLNVDKGATVIDTSAVERGQQGTFVFVVKPDNTVASRPVKLGTTEGEHVAVTSGLAVGERVVTDGADKLKEGMQVIVQGPASGAPGVAAGATAGAEPARRRRRDGAGGAAPGAGAATTPATGGRN
jgi:membrane fusion protein, multidrug efflux system